MLAFPCSSSDTRPSTGLIEVPLLDLPRSSWPPASDTGLDRHPVPPLPPALPHLIRPPPPRHSCPKVVRVTREFRKGRSLVSTRSCRVSVGSCSAPPRIFRLAGGVWPAQEALHPSQRAFDGLLLKSARVRSAGARAAGPGPSWARSGRWTRHLVASGPSPDLRAHSPPERQGLWAMLRAPSVSGRSSLFNPWFVQVAHVSLSLCPHRQAHAGYHSSPLAHRIGRQHTSSCLIGRCDPCLIKTAAANHDMERTQEPSSAKDRLEIWLIQTDLKESGGIHRDLG
ncbi:hypothetical protein G6F55_011668 [Rhizopus delemar]|nr:hypothetical protein G6F55_011668 [Rhizopus delemar]KAG1511448.1 hypothetical protein G6F52_010648 [Rhizopus delemar]